VCSKTWIILWAVMLSVGGNSRPAAAQQANLDLQERCAKQAQIAFNKKNFQDTKSASYTNHYNAKQNRCFIETEQDAVLIGADTIWYTKSVEDAYEGKIFAAYAWHTDKLKKYFRCTVKLPSGEDKTCASSDEFDELVKIYME
jgi:hypothetical protein